MLAFIGSRIKKNRRRGEGEPSGSIRQSLVMRAHHILVQLHSHGHGLLLHGGPDQH